MLFSCIFVFSFGNLEFDILVIMYLQENRVFYSPKNIFEHVKGFNHTILILCVMIDYHYILCYMQIRQVML